MMSQIDVLFPLICTGLVFKAKMKYDFFARNKGIVSLFEESKLNDRSIDNKNKIF